MGSQGNSRTGRERPNRSVVFSTDWSAAGNQFGLSPVGRYEGLRDDLLAWDSANGHGLGPGYFGLAASAYAAEQGGIAPKRPDGFNIEALAMQPDSKTDVYIGFRAPLVPPDDRHLALVIPVSNFTGLVDASAPAGAVRFGSPILLDLGGRGIRSMACNASNEYLIVAGPPGISSNAANDFMVFAWNGRRDSPPRPCRVDIAASGCAGDIEGILEVPPGYSGSCDVVLDRGATDWYGDGIPAKRHVAALRQFTSGRLAVRPTPSTGEVARADASDSLFARASDRSSCAIAKERVYGDSSSF
jgi:hypothetical protein